MNAQVIEFSTAAAKRRAPVAPSNACTRVGTARSPRALPSAPAIDLIGFPRRERPARVQAIRRKPRIPFFTAQYRSDFVEAAAIVLGYAGLAIVVIGKSLGVMP